jgi:hypothetical protein
VLYFATGFVRMIGVEQISCKYGTAAAPAGPGFCRADPSVKNMADLLGMLLIYCSAQFLAISACLLVLFPADPKPDVMDSHSAEHMSQNSLTVSRVLPDHKIKEPLKSCHNGAIAKLKPSSFMDINVCGHFLSHFSVKFLFLT